MQRDQTDTLLKYKVSTNPSPVDISSNNGPVTADIYIQVAANSDVMCKYISVRIPIGDDSTDMYATNPIPTASSDNSDWVESTDNIPGLSNGDESNTKNFLFKNIGDITVDNTVTFKITGTVNQQSGIVPITISELSTSVDDDTYATRSITQNITKMGEETFYLNAAVITYLDTPGLPVPLLDRNRGFQLQWQSNGDNFKIYPGGQSAEGINLGTQTSYQENQGVHTDTTYIIEAQKDDKYLYLEYTAHVKEPDVTLNSLTVETYTELLSGSTRTLGDIQKLAQGHQIPTQYYEASSDGFLMLSIAPIGVGDYDIVNTITLAGMVVSGCSFTTSGRAEGIGQTFNTVTVPIRNGDLFFFTATSSVRGNGMTTTVYWQGLGNGQPTPTTPMESDIQQAKKLEAEMEAILSMHKQKAAHFISAFEEAFDKKLSNETRESLIQKLL